MPADRYPHGEDLHLAAAATADKTAHSYRAQGPAAGPAAAGRGEQGPGGRRRWAAEAEDPEAGQRVHAVRQRVAEEARGREPPRVQQGHQRQASGFSLTCSLYPVRYWEVGFFRVEICT